METDAPLAPPVVAVVVVHAPGPWFDETLASLAAQDYPNLNTLFLLTGTAGDDLRERITRRLPDAFVRDLGANPGFGAAANEVLRLVEGESGFFCICHDDVALEPDAVRAMVEELYRSNAGVVGPKLVSWDDPSVLQHVGLGLAVCVLSRSLVLRHTSFGSLENYLSGYSIEGDALSALRIPATILTSADDPVIPIEDFRKLKLPPNVELDIAAHGGHCAFISDFSLTSFTEDYIAERMLAHAKPAARVETSEAA